MISDGELQKIEEYCMDVNDHTGVRLVQEIRRIREIRYKATEAYTTIISNLTEEKEMLRKTLKEISEYDEKCTDNEDFCNHVLNVARKALVEVQNGVADL